MREVRIYNPVLNSYITELASDYSSSVTVTVRNNNSFAANDLLVFGKPAEERTELKKLDSVSGSTTFTIASALNFSHGKGTPVFKSLWDFVSIEGRSSSAGTFAELTQSGIQWDSKENKTIYHHSSGTDTWEYRFRFYNSATTSYSEYSPTLTGAGFTRTQAGYLIREARKIAGDIQGEIVSTEELIRALVKAKYIIRSHNPRYWFWKVDGFNSSKTISATAGNRVYSLSSITDLGVIDYIEYRYNSNGTDVKYLLKRKGDVEFLALTRDLNRTSNDYPHLYRLLPIDSSSSKGYFEIENEIENSNVGTFYISYYLDETNYNSIDDTTAIVIPEILEDYLIAEIYATQGNEAMAKRYRDKFYGPQGRGKTSGAEKLDGIALLDELDRQYKEAQGQPKSLWRFRGQKAMSSFYGNRQIFSPDYVRENYFDGFE